MDSVKKSIERDRQKWGWPPAPEKRCGWRDGYGHLHLRKDVDGHLHIKQNADGHPTLRRGMATHTLGKLWMERWEWPPPP